MNESATAAASEEESPLKALQDILHNRIAQQKKREMQRPRTGQIQQRVWIETETLQWVLS